MKEVLYNDSISKEDFIESVEGAKIVGCNFKDDESGFHLELDDGRYIILSGEYMIWIGRLDKSKLQ